MLAGVASRELDKVPANVSDPEIAALVFAKVEANVPVTEPDAAGKLSCKRSIVHPYCSIHSMLATHISVIGFEVAAR